MALEKLLNGFQKTIRRQLHINLKTLAVIGGQGMLGSDLVRYLSQSFSITSISRENYSQFINHSFDLVVNANGNSKRFWAIKNPLEDFTASTVSVYKSILDFKFNTYIYISSNDVYVDHSNRAFTSENQVPDSSKLSSYGLHKYLCERIIENHCKSYIILRASMLLGRNLKKGPIYDIINNNPLFISKASRLQMISTKEVANVVKFLIDKGIENAIFNLGGKGIVDFEKIQTYFSGPVNFKNETETQIYEMNVSKLNKLFPLKSSETYLQEFLTTIK